MKQLAEFIPIALFFIVYQLKGMSLELGGWEYSFDGIYSATAVLMLATVAQVLLTWAIDVQIGIRYAQMDTQVSIEGVGQRDADNTIYDGILALRPRLALSKNWWFSPTMSIGAGDSDLTWELSPQFVYDCACGWDVRLGYRNLNYDFEKGSDSLDLTIKGPVIGVGFSF